MVMKVMSSRTVNSIPKGAIINCADNTGAKRLQVISVMGYKGIRRTLPRAGVGSLVLCRVYRGTEKVRHEKLRAVIIRQKKEYKRPDGMSVSFEDNAAIIVDDKLVPKGSLIKGPVAKEVVERFSAIGKVASIVV